MVWLQQSHKRVQSHNCWCCTSAHFVDDFHPKCSVPYCSCLGAKWIFPGSTNWLQPGDWSCTEAGAGHALPFSDKPKGSQVSAARAGGIVTFPSSLPAAPLAEPADKLCDSMCRRARVLAAEVQGMQQTALGIMDVALKSTLFLH